MDEYKLVVIGSGGVGKSCITIQYFQNTFVTEYEPTIEDSYRKKITVDGKDRMLEVLDTAGTEQFTAMRTAYIKNGNGFIVVYSIISSQSFKDIDAMIELIYSTKEYRTVPIIIVGNKCDLESERDVSKQEAETYARSKNLSYLEASAKTRINIDKIFTDLVRKISDEKKGAKKKSKSPCHVL
uniref:Ras-related protein Rap-1b (Trinotate prediction) n=1 Tax=Myxobolus squamalis TaxID=59785 RepID=A0A6B2G913_MYXSQ